MANRFLPALVIGMVLGGFGFLSLQNTFTAQAKDTQTNDYCASLIPNKTQELKDAGYQGQYMGFDEWKIDEAFYSKKAKDCMYILSGNSKDKKSGLIRYMSFLNQAKNNKTVALAELTEDDKFRAEPLFFSFVVNEYKTENN